MRFTGFVVVLAPLAACLPDTEGQGLLQTTTTATSPPSGGATSTNGDETVSTSVLSGPGTTGTWSASMASGSEGATVGTEGATGAGATFSTEDMMTTYASASSEMTIVSSSNGAPMDNCGNDVLDVDEECDQGESNGDASYCSGECKRTYRYVFVTSEVFDGNLGGVAGADSKCQELADDVVAFKAQNLKFRAWLSTSDDENTPVNEGASPGADDSWRKFSVPYVLPGEDMVFPGEHMVILGYEKLENDLMRPIDIDQNGNDVENKCDGQLCPVWTNTLVTGAEAKSGEDCIGWMTDSSDVSAWSGDIGKSNSEWTNKVDVLCNKSAHLYCFEQ